MCGIVGYSGAFAPQSLEPALRAIAHRGPDDSGTFVSAPHGIGLGHVRLSIQDLSALGHQPMSSADGQVVLIFNGEIYNFRELRTGLEADGYPFRGHSDTEVLLALYLRDGERMLPQLNGIFAFALWDARTQSLWLVRDALGVKPLYYAITGEGFLFGSEIKGLLRIAPGIRDLDQIALHRYLSFLWCPGEGTPFKAVRKVPPGSALLVKDGKLLRLESWYRLPVFDDTASDLGAEEAWSGTRDALRRAVHRQMVADVPVGAFLSGGLDSSAVVAFAREINPAIECFTIEAPGIEEEGFVDDLPYARAAARHLGVALRTVHIEPDRMAADLEMMVRQLDEPLADPAPLNVLYISRLARETGMKVLLSGAGGDDLFTGYRRHRAVQLDSRMAWVPDRVRSTLEAWAGSLDQRRTLSRRVAKMFNGFSLRGDARLANYFAWTREDELLALYTREFRQGVTEGMAAQPLLEFLRPLTPKVSSLDRILALEQRFFLADHNLTYTDKMSMAVGVEVRVPFLDSDLVQFAARIPAGLKQRGSVGKWVLKKAMEGVLPREIIYRPKSGFGAPLRRWMRRDLRPLMQDLLSPSSLSRRGIFDPLAVQRLVTENDVGRRDASYTLLSMMCIEIWCREFVDRNAQRSQEEA